MEKQLKALLLGSFGQANIGDDILMNNFVKYLQSEGFSKIYANASDISHIPSRLREKVIVKETYKTSVIEWLKTIRAVDAVFYGGGTIYKELYASTGRKKYAVIIRMAVFNAVASFFGKPVYNLNIGIGTLNTRIGKIITKMGLLFSTYTIFRDPQSYDFAKNILKINHAKISSGKDGLFIDNNWHRPRDKKSILPKPKVIGFNALYAIPDWINYDNYLKEIRLFLNYLLKNNYFIVFIPFQYAVNAMDDKKFMETNLVPYLDRQNYKIIDSPALDELINIYNNIDMLIGMRFHSLLLGLSTATPFLSIEYDTKCTRFMEEHSYPHSVKIEKLSFDSLKNSFLNLVNERQDVHKNLDTLARKLYSNEPSDMYLVEKMLKK
jgi:polysaccharide pyruvyl transferase WcaK-like protein